MGHHFATIAGGGPIVGPVSAAVFGWIPAVIWIVLGSIFIGGVHDYTALQASIRHKAQSIGTIIKEYIGKRGQTLFLAFSVATLILIVGVFIILVRDTFVNVPEAATSSLLFIGLAVLFGILVNQLRMNFLLASALGVIAMFAAVWFGNVFPLHLSGTTWVIILLAYSYIASVLPVWILLQPRDYLNSFLLYGMILGAVIGIIFANPVMKMDGYTGFYNETLGYMFPILFITIACGAVSGFHSLVSSGTTAKQLDNEKKRKIHYLRWDVTGRISSCHRDWFCRVFNTSRIYDKACRTWWSNSHILCWCRIFNESFRNSRGCRNNFCCLSRIRFLNDNIRLSNPLRKICRTRIC